MEKEFMPYAEALALKELGFNEPCFKVYDTLGYIRDEKEMDNLFLEKCLAPLYQQAFRWFREKYDYDGYFFSNTSYRYRVVIKKIYTMENLVDIMTDTYEEAELECLKKLIEIIQTNS
jgi:hypothetical protein